MVCIAAVLPSAGVRLGQRAFFCHTLLLLLRNYVEKIC